MGLPGPAGGGALPCETAGHEGDGGPGDQGLGVLDEPFVVAGMPAGVHHPLSDPQEGQHPASRGQPVDHTLEEGRAAVHRRCPVLRGMRLEGHRDRAAGQVRQRRRRSVYAKGIISGSQCDSVSHDGERSDAWYGQCTVVSTDIAPAEKVLPGGVEKW